MAFTKDQYQRILKNLGADVTVTTEAQVDSTGNLIPFDRIEPNGPKALETIQQLAQQGLSEDVHPDWTNSEGAVILVPQTK